MKVLFWLNKTKSNRLGEAPIMMRLTHKGVRHNVTLDLKIKPETWDSKRQKIRGSSETATTQNNLIRSYNNRALDALEWVLKEKADFTIEDIIQKFKGEDITDVGFVQMCDKFISNMAARVGSDFHPSTVDKYRYTKQNLTHYLRDKLNTTDIPLRLVNRTFVADLNQYLRGEKRFHNNHVNKSLSQLRSVFKTAITYGLVNENPFDILTFKRTETHKDFLNMAEIKKLILFEPTTNKLAETKDVFLFLCFTGLAHVDAQKVTAHNIMVGIDNNPWLVLQRTKTSTQVNVPILPIVAKLIEKYSLHPKCLKEKRLMPIPANQVLNRNLKDLSGEIGFNKKLTSHCGRYTFASTILMSNGIRVEVAQRLLAHNSIKSTMIYGKLSQSSIANDVLHLNKVLNEVLELPEVAGE